MFCPAELLCFHSFTKYVDDKHESPDVKDTRINKSLRHQTRGLVSVVCRDLHVQGFTEDKKTHLTS